jgi:type IX secretion system PorP/SprF family membrane protein
MKHGYLFVIFLIAAFSVQGQYFQYSQYNYTAQRINPALVAASNYASLGMLYRQQATGGDVNLKSSFVSGSYPIINKRNGHRWSGVGMAIMDDRAGGIFSTQEVSLSYGVNVFLSRYQTLSLGFKGLYQQRKINLDGLFTGSQFIPDRGFDRSIYNGENIQFLRSDYVTFSTGLQWQETDREGNRLAYFGASIFDFNKPQESFSGTDNQLSSTLIIAGGVRLFENKEIAIMPEFLFTRSAAANAVNAGAITSYFLRSAPNQPASRIDIITKYAMGRSGIIGLQLHRENFTIGASYDFPVVKTNAANVNAFEVGIELRKLMDPKMKRRTLAKKKTEQKPVTKTGVEKKLPEKKPVRNNLVKTTAKKTADSLAQAKKAQTDLKSKLQYKQDSVLASAQAGSIRHEPLMIEKVTLHFNFEFNSTDLDDESVQYLDNLVAALKDNRHLRIRLTGHTDNIGSVKFNQRLSLFRANSIKDHFVSRGVAATRIDTDGRGLSEPLNENRTEEERAKNRRVELQIYYEE